MAVAGFNTQPPEGGWHIYDCDLLMVTVSTHSRPKAAGPAISHRLSLWSVSTHSRPKAAGPRNFRLWFFETVSTHSRPKAAGYLNVITKLNM